MVTLCSLSADVSGAALGGKVHEGDQRVTADAVLARRPADPHAGLYASLPAGALQPCGTDDDALRPYSPGSFGGGRGEAAAAVPVERAEPLDALVGPVLSRRDRRGDLVGMSVPGCHRHQLGEHRIVDLDEFHLRQRHVRNGTVRGRSTPPNSAGTLAAQTGATTNELMARLGRASPQAAMVYEHASLARDVVIAECLAQMAERAGPAPAPAASAQAGADRHGQWPRPSNGQRRSSWSVTVSGLVWHACGTTASRRPLGSATGQQERPCEQGLSAWSGPASIR